MTDKLKRILRFLLSSLVWVGVLAVVDRILYTVLDAGGLTVLLWETFRSGTILLLYMALVTVIAIGIIGWLSGVIFHIATKTMYLAVTIYVVLEALASVVWSAYGSWVLSEPFPWLVVGVLFVRYVVVLGIALVLTKVLSRKGRRLHERIKERSSGAR